MNRIALIVSLSVLGGCTANPGPLYIDGIGVMDKGCAMPSDIKVFLSRGSLDLANWPATPSNYLAVLQISGWDSVHGIPTVSSNSQIGTLEPATRRYVLDKLRLSYKASKGSPLGTRVNTTCPPATGGETGWLECDVQTTYGAGQGKQMLGEYLIGQNMRNRLLELATNNVTIDPFTLFVTIEATGREFQLDKPITTGPIVFPIVVSKSDCGTKGPGAPDECGAIGVNGSPACGP